MDHERLGSGELQKMRRVVAEMYASVDKTEELSAFREIQRQLSGSETGTTSQEQSNDYKDKLDAVARLAIPALEKAKYGPRTMQIFSSKLIDKDDSLGMGSMSVIIKRATDLANGLS